MSNEDEEEKVETLKKREKSFSFFPSIGIRWCVSVFWYQASNAEKENFYT